MLEKLKKNKLYNNGLLVCIAIGLIALVVSIIAYYDYNYELGIFCLVIFIITCLIPLEYIVAACFYLSAFDKGYKDKFYLWFAFIFNIIGYMLIISLPDRGNVTSKEIDIDALPEI